MKLILKVVGGILLFLVLSAGFFYTPDKETEELIKNYKFPTSSFIQIDNHAVHVRKQGKGPVLLCVHGFGGNMRNWDGWTNELSDSYTVISYDLPGYGLTGPRIDADYSDSTQVSFLKLLVEELKIDSFSLAGNSMGGAIAWQYALAYPDDVTDLVLVDPSGYKSVREDLGESSTPIGFRMLRQGWMKNIMSNFTPKFIVKSTLRDSYGNPSAINDEDVQVVHDLMRYPGNRKALFERMSIRQSPPFERLSSIRIPTLIMWGDMDRVIPVSHSYEFEKLLPNDSIIIYEGVGHLPMDEIPERSAKDLIAFLER